MNLSAIAGRPLALDIALAVGLTLLSLATVIAGAGDIGAVGGVGLILLLLETLPLAARRIMPVPVWLVTLTATATHLFVSAGAPASIRATLGALIALFTVSERYGRRNSIWAPLISWAAVGGVIIYRTGFPAGLGGLVQVAVSVSVAWILGTWSRERRAHADQAEARALAAERLKEDDARRAVAEERQRIARELHDVVTHHVSVMVIQAEAAESALASRPGDAATAIAAIASTGRQALTDMRTMLGVLGPSADSEEGIARAAEPMPSLDRLGDLMESLRAAGLSIELSVTGQRRSLHPGIELSAYRIIQEALTNTLKHARGARALVSVHFGASDVTVAVADEGGGRAGDAGHDGAGRGLVGMRERTAMFGGDFSAEPTDRGFRVQARLPLVLEANR